MLLADATFEGENLIWILGLVVLALLIIYLVKRL